jgi:hypothetical protein
MILKIDKRKSHNYLSVDVIQVDCRSKALVLR